MHHSRTRTVYAQAQQSAAKPGTKRLALSPRASLHRHRALRLRLEAQMRVRCFVSRPRMRRLVHLGPDRNRRRRVQLASALANVLIVHHPPTADAETWPFASSAHMLVRRLVLRAVSAAVSTAIVLAGARDAVGCYRGQLPSPDLSSRGAGGARAPPRSAAAQLSPGLAASARTGWDLGVCASRATAKLVHVRVSH